MIEFPKMIYRPRAEPNSELGGRKVDYMVVNSQSEQDVAVGQGWHAELADAIARVESKERRDARTQAVRSWYERWEWALKAAAVMLGIVAGVVAILKVL